MMHRQTSRAILLWWKSDTTVDSNILFSKSSKVMVGNGCELGHLKRDRKDISVERSRMLESKKRLFYVLLIGLSVTLHIATISMVSVTNVLIYSVTASRPMCM